MERISSSAGDGRLEAFNHVAWSGVAMLTSPRPWATDYGRAIAGRLEPRTRLPGAARSVLQLHVVPKPDPVSYPCMGAARRFVRPSRALARVGSIGKTEKLNAVGTAMVRRGLWG